jgi:hypothetical protein
MARGKMKKNVLVACECSGRVREAFRKRGHNAWSCDLLPAEDGSPNHHQGNVFNFSNGWDLVVAHPPCTYLSVSGARWFYHPDDSHLFPEQRRSHPRYPDRRWQQDEAAEFFMSLAELPIPEIAIENPVCVMSTRWRKPDQIIQPYEYGDPFKKKTCLWLRGLPLLKPTNIVEPRIITYRDGSKFSADYGFCKSGGKRSKTYQGIADAMAEQWGS